MTETRKLLRNNSLWFKYATQEELMNVINLCKALYLASSGKEIDSSKIESIIKEYSALFESECKRDTMNWIAKCVEHKNMTPYYKNLCLFALTEITEKMVQNYRLCGTCGKDQNY